MLKFINRSKEIYKKLLHKKNIPENHFKEVSIGLNCQFIGMNNITIGKGSCVGDNSWLNVCIRDEKIRMTIGETVLIGRQSVISAANILTIGAYCVFAPRVYISNADHLYKNIDLPILCQGFVQDKILVIEENCWFGINCVIIGNITVGRGSVVAANAVVTKDIPPFSVVAGAMSEIIKMYNPKTKTWDRVQSQSEIDNIIFLREQFPLPGRDEYLEKLKKSNLTSIEPIVGGGNIHI